MKGIFAGKCVIEYVDAGIAVSLEGAQDALGFGEAIGIAAGAWLAAADPLDREKEFRQMLVGFLALANSPPGRHVSGSVEYIDAGGDRPPNGSKVS